MQLPTNTTRVALVHLRNGRLAVLDHGTLLAVPPMHPVTSRATRRQVIEYVLRRQIGLAHTLAADEADDIRRRHSDRTAALMSKTPHRSSRAAAA